VTVRVALVTRGWLPAASVTSSEKTIDPGAIPSWSRFTVHDQAPSGAAWRATHTSAVAGPAIKLKAIDATPSPVAFADSVIAYVERVAFARGLSHVAPAAAGAVGVGDGVAAGRVDGGTDCWKDADAAGPSDGAGVTAESHAAAIITSPTNAGTSLGAGRTRPARRLTRVSLW
jgi:hypothetical protein